MSLDARERLIEWMKQQRQSLTEQIELFSSGRAQFREYRDGRMTDVTGETLKKLHQHKKELDGLLADFGAKYA